MSHGTSNIPEIVKRDKHVKHVPLVGGFKHSDYFPFHIWDIYGYIILPHWLTYICFKMVIAPPASPTFSRVFSVKHPQQKSAMLSNCLARPGPTKSWTLWGVAKPWNVMCAFCWSSPSAGRVDRVDVRCGLLLLVFGDGLLFWNFVCWCCWNWTFTVTAT